MNKWELAYTVWITIVAVYGTGITLAHSDLEGTKWYNLIWGVPLAMVLLIPMMLANFWDWLAYKATRK